MDLASLCRWYTLGSKGPQSIEISGREPVVRILLPPAKSRRPIGSAVWESTRARVRFRGAGCEVCFGS